MKILYTTQATATGGRNGAVKSANGVIDTEVRPPKALGGDSDDYTNPEQLFAAGYAACFGSALDHAAGNAGISTENASVTVTVGIGQEAKEKMGLTVEIRVELPNLGESQAQELLEKADQLCPYSNAVRGNIEKTLTLAAHG